MIQMSENFTISHSSLLRLCRFVESVPGETRPEVGRTLTSRQFYVREDEDEGHVNYAHKRP